MNYESVDAIKQLLKERRDTDAEKALRRLDAQGRASAESHYLLGSIFHQRNQLPEAVEAFRRALQMDPHFVDAAISLSIIYNDTGHYQQGQAVFEQAERSVETGQVSSVQSKVLARELAQKHVELGTLYRKLQRFDEAASEFFKATRLIPEDLTARIELAKTHAQRGNFASAKEELLSLTREHPESAEVRVQLALFYQAQGNALAAQEELSLALQQNPGNKLVKTYLELTKQSSETTL